MTKTIDQLCAEAFNNSANHGFWDEYYRTVALLNTHDKELAAKYEVDVKLSKAALIGSELGEMVEGIRKPGPDQHCPNFTQEEVELADIFIRGFDYAGKYGLRLSAAIEAKMAYNASRPYKHGKKA